MVYFIQIEICIIPIAVIKSILSVMGYNYRNHNLKATEHIS